MFTLFVKVIEFRDNWRYNEWEMVWYVDYKVKLVVI